MFARYSGIRSLPSKRDIFLSFDDGPHSYCTQKLLEELSHRSALATFFVIAKRARNHKALIRTLIDRGHTIGNHSLDHDHSILFKGKREMRQWIQTAEEELRAITGQATVGFRPPAGIITPPMVEALQELGLRLILWQHRFYDSVFPLRPWMVHLSQRYLRGGEIVLLHEGQSRNRFPDYLKTLDTYIEGIQKRGYILSSIPVS